MHMKESKSISEYFFVVSYQLKRKSEKLEDVRIMEKILRSLDLKFEHIFVTVEETQRSRDYDNRATLGIFASL